MNHITRGVKPCLFFSFALILCFVTLTPRPAYAGIYDANSPVTYKEYWVPHSEFDGNCPPADPVPNSDLWYIEPQENTCERDLIFQIPDAINGALKAEIYLDLWRNHNERTARFKLNNGLWRTPTVGSDWSRSPYVGVVPLSELQQGTNHIYFINDGTSRVYHVHDIAIRIYHDNSHPLVPGSGSDVTPPTGALTAIQASNGTFNPASGGTLNVDNNEITLSAVVTDATMIEFHAFYDGYDLDNDGIFREWQNRGRNNCYPGGSTFANGCAGAQPAVGGTIDHIGTTGSAGSFSNCSWNGGTNTATCTWDLHEVVNQSGVRFKIRALDASGNVIDAAGGDSANFTLFRNHPTAAFYNPDFVDEVLHHDGEPGYSDFYTTTVQLPSNVSSYGAAYLLGSYWRNPRITINDRTLPQKNGRAFVQGGNAPEDDFWTLSKLEIPSGRLSDGANAVQYAYGNAFGEFIEKPGPLIVLRSTTGGFTDATAPITSGFEPTSGSINVDPAQVVTVYVEDDFGVGVDYTSLQMRVNGTLVSPKISGFSNRYKLTYSPSGGFPNSTFFTVTIDAKDIAGNVMPQATYSFTIEDPDVTPPVISNIVVIPGFTQAIIRWETDEPADSKVDFGATASYTATVTDANLVTFHEVVLPDLHPDAAYHFMITSADSDLNTTMTGDNTFATAQQIVVVSDDFNYCSTDDARWDKWEFVNPRGDATYALTGEELRISVPGGVEHDVWSNGTPIIRAPHLLQNATDPNLIHVVFTSKVSAGIEQQGILAIQDENNFIRVNFQYVAGEVQFIAVRVRDGNARAVKSGIVPNGTSNEPLHLLLLRDEKNLWKPRFSRDGVNWTSIGSFTEAFAINKVGIYAGNASDGSAIPAFDMTVDYFFNDNAPILAEDAVAQVLPVSANPTDKGTVTKDVDCGNPVTLTAQAVPGWSFTGWGGSISGTENPKSVGFTFGNFAIANFEQDQYTLAINKAGDGSVSHTPEQATYLYNDTVSLTATPTVGWSFGGWSGALTGMTNPATLLMDESKVVTATFTQNQYLLTLTASDAAGGMIVASPSKTTYVYNEQVTLVATPTLGWTFVGWGGDATGTESPLIVTMTEDRSITAIFIKDQYTLVTAVSGNGAVSRTPDQTIYEYGNQVTLQATTSAAGWVFDRWTGDLSGVVNPATITMTDNQSITAVFTRTQHTVQTFINGNGRVALTPEKPIYYYGDVVIITALPDSGWTLDGWSGSISGRDNPVELTIDGNKSIVAAFVEAPNELTTTVTGQGTIKRSPQLQFYKTGDVVGLTAVAEPGWRFTGWTGAISGTENPTQLTMDDDKTVSATFVPLAYTLNVAVATTVTGTDPLSNTVTVNPNLAEYTFGDNVTLTPLPAPGWSFARWGGDLTGTANPGQLEITSAMAVTAYFTPTLYTIDLGIGSTGEGGHVTTLINGVENNGPFTHGQEVTLKAVADPGYVFNGWLITDPQAANATVDGLELTITIPDARQFQATFVKAAQQIFLPVITR